MDQVTSGIELPDKMGFACMIVGEQDIMIHNNNPAADHVTNTVDDDGIYLTLKNLELI